MLLLAAAARSVARWRGGAAAGLGAPRRALLHAFAPDTAHPLENELYFLPLGGCGEIGLNANLYYTQGKWLMVDLGVKMPAEHMAGNTEMLMPDVSFIAERAKDLAGLVITHGHEDHIGAIPYLWPRLRCPIYATPFAANLVKSKIREMRKDARMRDLEIEDDIDWRIVNPGQTEQVSGTKAIRDSRCQLHF